ncbi:MAG: N-acetylmuramoyl-L-alanine amidase [Bacteroidales bacterium]|nr:N-acetylmuramoyl-L-alanine amidase [Bacteroidales bacterium]
MQTLLTPSIKQILISVLLSSITIFAAFSQNNEDDFGLKTVVIDPGHGGKDPGTVGKLEYEKNVVLKISLLVGKLINQNYPNINVVYTRDKDKAVDLYERANIANKNKADLFISIHANAIIGRPDVNGTETYTMGLKKADRNLEVVQQENSVITLEDDYTTKYQGFDPNSTESMIMFDLMSDNSQDNSINFASLVETEFKTKLKRHSRGVKQGALVVLILSSMPRVLIEVGYMSNKKEEKYLISNKGQQEIANSIYRAFANYKTLIDGKTSFTKKQKTIKKEPTTSSTETYFKIQVLTSSLNPEVNKNWNTKENNFEAFKAGKYYKYTILKETDFSKICTELKKIKKRFPDAFIVGVKNGTIIPALKAKKELQNRTTT